jgi:hypothetical protein
MRLIIVVLSVCRVELSSLHDGQSIDDPLRLTLLTRMLPLQSPYLAPTSVSPFLCATLIVWMLHEPEDIVADVDEMTREGSYPGSFRIASPENQFFENIIHFSKHTLFHHPSPNPPRLRLSC